MEYQVVRTKTYEKERRLEKANKIIVAISKYGRRFFSLQGDRPNWTGPNCISCLELDQRGRVWLIDKYTHKRIYTAYKYNWRGFSDGGTLRSLVESLRDYILHDKPIPSYHLGPWPDYICGGDLWGYGEEEMQKVRDEVKAILKGEPK